MENGGINAVLGLVSFFEDSSCSNKLENGFCSDESCQEDSYLDTEMEGLITFCMTSICFKREDYDFDDSFGEGVPDRDYSTMKPVLRYLQSILIK